MAKGKKKTGGPREIRVFIASPGDLAVERRAFKNAIELLNVGFGDGAEVQFVPLGWEDTLATTGRRVQSVIDQDIDSCDVFVLALHRRWGQEAPDAKPYTSYTEEEFHRALDRFRKTKSPEIFVFFKNVDPASRADAGPQLEKVLKFRQTLEDTGEVLYRTFDDEKQFQAEVDRHLRAFAKGELPEMDGKPGPIILPLEYVDAVKRAEAESTRVIKQLEASHQKEEAEKAKREELALFLARQAAEAAGDGRLEESRQSFAKAVNGTTSIDVLLLAFEFYYRTGELTVAEEMLRRWLAISGEDNKTADTAAAIGNFGLICQNRSELDRAEELFREALAINERLAWQEGIARDYGNLSGIYQVRGELDRAEEMLRKALVIDERLGCEEGMAGNYSNLGLIYLSRGEFDRAEEMHRKSLAIEQKLGRQEGMASDYGNLGLIYWGRGDLDEAEEMFRKALVIDEKLGRQNGIAMQYGNLGGIYQARGELEEAELMNRKTLAISEKLGWQEGIAITYNNLGVIFRNRGQIEEARRLWTRARDIFSRIGMPRKVKQVQDELDRLAEKE